MPPISLAEARNAPRAALPTYRTAADVLENRNGSGTKLILWSIARTIMIAPAFLVVGVDAKKAWGGAALSSALISAFTLFRIYNAGEQLHGLRATRRRSTRRRPHRRSR